MDSDVPRFLREACDDDEPPAPAPPRRMFPGFVVGIAVGALAVLSSGPVATLLEPVVRSLALASPHDDGNSPMRGADQTRGHVLSEAERRHADQSFREMRVSVGHMAALKYAAAMKTALDRWAGACLPSAAEDSYVRFMDTGYDDIGAGREFLDAILICSFDTRCRTAPLLREGHTSKQRVCP